MVQWKWSEVYIRYIYTILAPCNELLVASPSSSLIFSTRSCLLHLLNALASSSYVALDPSLCFHILSIASLCACTERGGDPTMSTSSVAERPRSGAMSCHCAISREISRRCSSEHGCFHLADWPWGHLAISSPKMSFSQRIKCRNLMIAWGYP